MNTSRSAHAADVYTARTRRTLIHAKVAQAADTRAARSGRAVHAASRGELILGNQKRSIGRLLEDPAVRPGIAGTAYDTAWLATVPSEHDQGSSRFPAALRWLVDNQLPDGSWGGAIRYEHDRVLSTLAALTPLAIFGRHGNDQACLAAGTRYLWQHGHLLSGEPAEPVGFELLLPTLIQRALRVGVAVPPHLDIYTKQREEKLRLIPPSALYSPYVTVVHSLEFLGDQADDLGLQTAQGSNGGIGNSPAATAFWYAKSQDRRALGYLQECLDRAGGASVPVLYPCETFELLWAAYHLFLSGVPPAVLLNGDEQKTLRAALLDGGVSLSATFPIADADDTAVALVLLQALGEAVDAGVLQAFAQPDGHFASFPHERHPSVGVNLHVLQALLRVPGYPNQDRVVEHLVDYLIAEQVDGMYWFDKWHISPYYVTAHALYVLSELPLELLTRVAPHLDRSREWLRQTQNVDGSWGFYEQPTAEETAYGVLGLSAGGPALVSERDRRQCTAGARYLKLVAHPGERERTRMFPPLWIDKCLYTPTLVVEAVVEAALLACSQLTTTAEARRTSIPCSEPPRSARRQREMRE